MSAGQVAGQGKVVASFLNDGTTSNPDSQYYIQFVEPIMTEYIAIEKKVDGSILQIDGIWIISDPLGKALC